MDLGIDLDQTPAELPLSAPETSRPSRGIRMQIARVITFGLVGFLAGGAAVIATATCMALQIR